MERQMRLSPRWDKVLRDSGGNKLRSLLVVFSIATGIAVVGATMNAARMIRRDIFDAYRSGNPASVVIYASPFQDDLAPAVEAMREVQYADARRVVSALVNMDDGKQEDIELYVLADFTRARLNQLALDPGVREPGTREIYLERQSAAGLGLSKGDSLTVERADGSQHRLTVARVIYDRYSLPYNLLHRASGYVSMSTLAWMGEPSYYNQLSILVAENKTDREHVLEVAAAARDRVIEPAGYTVGDIQVPGMDADPGEFWAQKQMNGVSLMAIFLSAGLIINTISAMIAQQVKQIGIMRSVGASRGQLVAIYLVNVLIFSLLGLAIAVPLGLLGSLGLTCLALDFFNGEFSTLDISPGIFLLQSGLALLMPAGVALYPILSGTSVSVYDAIYQSGVQASGGRGWIERLLDRIRNFYPPVLLSLRNTFRNKSRLAFTLVTLTLAGAVFIAVFSTHASLIEVIDEFNRYMVYDASLSIPGGRNKYTVEREALRVTGVDLAEGWLRDEGVIIRADGTEGDHLEIVGLPQDSETIEPRLIAGRWLRASDTLEIVVNQDLLVHEPEIAVGKAVTIRINGVERSFQVVGIASKHISTSRAYIKYEELGKLTGQHNQVNLVRVRATPGPASPAQQEDIAAGLEGRFSDAGLSQSSGQTQHATFQGMTDAFNLLLIVLLIVAGMLALVGGLGLTGTMGMNVLERTREVGVLRAIGASNKSVWQVVIVEGVVISLVSWGLSAVLSLPVSRMLSEAIVFVTFDTRFAFQYSAPGLLIWLAVVAAIGCLASLAPARDAVRLTVREVLDYE
jgi:putative ABC transport system permease protein